MNVNSFRSTEGGGENEPQSTYHLADLAMDKHADGEGARFPKPPASSDQGLDELERRKLQLLEEVRILEERRAALQKGSGFGMSLLDDPESGLDEIVRHLEDPSSVPVRADESALLLTESEFSLNQRLGFAKMARKAIMEFVQFLYDKRFAERLQSSGTDAEHLSALLGHINAEDMRYRIVGKIAVEMYEGYLQHEGISFEMGSLMVKIDRALGAEILEFPKDAQVGPDVMNRVYHIFIKFVYHVAREIVEEEAKVRSAEERRKFTSDAYAKEYARMDLDHLLQQITQFVATGMGHAFKTNLHEMNHIDGRTIRHVARNTLYDIISPVLQVKQGIPPEEVSYPPLHGDSDVPLAIREAYRECVFEHEVLHLGHQGMQHKRLPESDLRFINDSDLFVRLAGYDEEGNRLVSAEPDFELFEQLERRHFLEWKQPLMGQSHEKKLTPEQRRAIQRFHQEGGHVGPMSREAIEFIHRHGVILFIERKVRDDLVLTLGSISALSRTPTSRPSNNEDPDDPGNWHLKPHTLELFPQYDFAKVVSERVSSEILELHEAVREQLLICRTSVISALGPDMWEWQCERQNVDLRDAANDLLPLRNRSLRRLGLGGRLKAELFEIATSFGSKYLTFNIGTLREPGGQSGLEMVNKPSSEHNRWMATLGIRDYKNDIGGGVRMLWSVYQGRIERGMDEFYRKNGLLRGKGWDIERVKQSAQGNKKRLLRRLLEKDHEPW